ncbi:hypothetical protein ACWC9T_39180 [Kitasatospora sp. NPDC001159]
MGSGRGPSAAGNAISGFIDMQYISTANVDLGQWEQNCISLIPHSF